MKVSILGVLFLLPCLALGHPGHKLEAYGDSLTAGFLAGTNVTTPPDLKGVSKILSDLAMFFITSDFKFAEQYHRRDLAWPGRLKEMLEQDGSPVDMENRAVSGSGVGAMVSQLVDQGNDVGALFFSGHNDICGNSKPVDEVIDDFTKQYDGVLAQWDKTHTNSHAHLMAVTRVDKVFTSLVGFPWHQGKTTYRCEDNWRKYFPYCPGYYKMLQAGKLVEFLQPRIDGMNAALEKLVEKYNRESKSNVFHYLGKVTELSFVPEFFSIDCYHLSAAGQLTIGSNVFRDSYF